MALSSAQSLNFCMCSVCTGAQRFDSMVRCMPCRMQTPHQGSEQLLLPVEQEDEEAAAQHTARPRAAILPSQGSCKRSANARASNQRTHVSNKQLQCKHGKKSRNNSSERRLRHSTHQTCQSEQRGPHDRPQLTADVCHFLTALFL